MRLKELVSARKLYVRAAKKFQIIILFLQKIAHAVCAFCEAVLEILAYFERPRQTRRRSKKRRHSPVGRIKLRYPAQQLFIAIREIRFIRKADVFCRQSRKIGYVIVLAKTAFLLRRSGSFHTLKVYNYYVTFILGFYLYITRIYIFVLINICLLQFYAYKVVYSVADANIRHISEEEHNSQHAASYSHCSYLRPAVFAVLLATLRPYSVANNHRYGNQRRPYYKRKTEQKRFLYNTGIHTLVISEDTVNCRRKVKIICF